MTKKQTTKQEYYPQCSHPWLYLISIDRVSYHRFRWYATLENKTPAETFPKFPSVIRVIDRSDRNPPISATSLTFWPSLRHDSGLSLVDFDPICREHVRLTEILETFPRVFCFLKSRINENGGKQSIGNLSICRSRGTSRSKAMKTVISSGKANGLKSAKNYLARPRIGR